MTTCRTLTATLATTSLLLGGLLYHSSAERGRQAARLESMRLHAEALEREAAASRRQADSLSTRLAELAPSPIHELYIDRLRKRGLEHPVEDLIADLQLHAELIPFPGVLGGRMGFPDKDRIRVLSGSWVYAPFEDGHIAGEAIFEYEVTGSGQVSWRVVQARRL